MITVVAQISSQPDAESAIKQILQDLVGPSRNEPGCHGYKVLQNNENPLEFLTIENWADQASADAHLASPHVALAIAKAIPLLKQPPIIRHYVQIL
jgi:quinol monooxygenase YgiN